MKTCPACDLTKARDEFNIRKASLDGLQGYCRACSRLYGIKYYRENREERLEYISQYQRANPDAHRRRIQAYRARQKEVNA